jgi:hypothetical protein
MELINLHEFKFALAQLEYFTQREIIEDAIRAGAKPVHTAMVANAPQSTGSRDKQSASTKSKWAAARKLKTTIRTVVRLRTHYSRIVGRYALVGPSYSEGGGHGNLFSKDHTRKVLWGRDSGAVRQVNQFVKKTSDETMYAALNAVNASLRSGFKAVANRINK